MKKVKNKWTNEIIGKFDIEPTSNLSRADLSGANLFEANLSGTNLSEADLSKAKYSLLHIFNIKIKNISDELCLELMRRDAAAHPNSKAFDTWANGGNCPIATTNIQRMFNFNEKRNIYKPGKPKLTDWELWIQIAKELDITI